MILRTFVAIPLMFSTAICAATHGNNEQNVTGALQASIVKNAEHHETKSKRFVGKYVNENFDLTGGSLKFDNIEHFKDDVWSLQAEWKDGGHPGVLFSSVFYLKLNQDTVSLSGKPYFISEQLGMQGWKRNK